MRGGSNKYVTSTCRLHLPSTLLTSTNRSALTEVQRHSARCSTLVATTATTTVNMLIKTSYRDVETKADGRSGKMRIFVIEPNVPEYPDAKFPGCECRPSAPLRCFTWTWRPSFHSLSAWV